MTLTLNCKPSLTGSRSMVKNLEFSIRDSPKISTATVRPSSSPFRENTEIQKIHFQEAKLWNISVLLRSFLPFHRRPEKIRSLSIDLRKLGTLHRTRIFAMNPLFSGTPISGRIHSLPVRFPSSNSEQIYLLRPILPL